MVLRERGRRSWRLTEGTGELSVDDDVGISPDGRGEVGVARDVEGIVPKLRLLLHRPSAEVASQLRIVAQDTDMSTMVSNLYRL